MSEQLLRAINKVQSEIADHPNEFHDEEENTKDYLIKPILNALGWQGLTRLKNQHKLGRKRVDMALLQQGAPVVLVEAKALNIQLDDEPLDQIIGYCIRSKKAETALLTNGVDWRVYRPWLKNLDFEQRLLFQLRLDRDDAAESAKKLNLLRYEDINRLDSEDTRILLDAYWNVHGGDELLNEFAGLLRESIVAWSGKGLGEIPTGKVKSWLRKKMFSGRRAPVSRRRVQHVQSSTKGTERAVVLAGEQIPIKHANEVLIQTAEWLVRQDRLHKEICPVIIGSGKLYLIHKEPTQPNGEKFRGPKELSNGLFVSTNFGTPPLINKSRNLLIQFGYPPDTLHVFGFD